MNDKSKVSYSSKEITVCPVCAEKFKREELHVGRGRLIVDSLTDQLRHTYKPSQEYGIVNPLLYPVTVCPNCMYAAFKGDFGTLSEDVASKIEAQRAVWTKDVRALFPMVNFVKKRSLPEGISSYYLALHCYNAYPAHLSPTFRQALCALRCAWLCDDMCALNPEEHWGTLQAVLYRKCRYLYKLAIEKEENGSEALPEKINYGPDTEKNYGIDGIYYLASLLEYHYGPRNDTHKRHANLKVAKIWLSRIFGLGESSKIKPQVLLDNSRTAHRSISRELEQGTGS